MVGILSERSSLSSTDNQCKNLLTIVPKTYSNGLAVVFRSTLVPMPVDKALTNDQNGPKNLDVHLPAKST